MTQIYGFDSESAIDRVISAVRKVEGQRPAAQSPRVGFGIPAALLKITGGDSGGLQPAAIVMWDDATAADMEIGDEVRLKHPNGITLQTGTYVDGGFTGFTAAGDFAVFECDSGVGGPGKGTIFKVLTNWECVSNVPTLTFKYVWLPPGAVVYDDLASAEAAHSGASEE